MDYILTAGSLWKSYKGFHALSGLNMHVPKGSVYGLVGRNGAGKTTLIRLICGLQAPTSGGFTLFGLDSRDKGIHKARRRMGAVVETPSIYLDLSAADNIKEQYRVLGVPSDEGVNELLELVGLADASGWASPSLWPGTRTFWCWTSRSTAWTPRASSRPGS